MTIGDARAIDAWLVLVTEPTPLGGPAEDDLVARVAVAARAGVPLIQVRQPAAEGRPLFRLVERCLAATAPTAARIIVNDRLDVALAAGAHGVHLRADSPPAPRVRTITPPGFLVGRSVHAIENAARAAALGGVDYLLFGTIFPSASKPGRAAAGTAALEAIASAAPVPVLAIGGITIDRMPAVRRAGAAGVAAIGLFAAPPLDDLPRVVEAARRAALAERARATEQGAP